MSIAPSRPAAIFRDPPYYGPDGRYIPPSDIGELPDELPGHLELPEENGEIVENFREAPQNVLLDTVIQPILERLHPNHDFALGHDCGIYWKMTDPPEQGAICPDWLYIPGVPPVLGRDYRRSYVLWKENVPPVVMIEYASEDGSKERRFGRLANGKFWIYEKAVQGLYYAIFVVSTGDLEVYRLEKGLYQPLQPDPHGHYPIEPLGVALGVWHGFYLNEVAPWLRWYDLQGNLMPLDAERAEAERRRAEEQSRLAEAERHRAEEQSRLAEAERHRAEEQSRLADEIAHRLAEERGRAEEQTRLAAEERHRAEQLAAKLRELGIDPDQLGT